MSALAPKLRNIAEEVAAMENAQRASQGNADRLEALRWRVTDLISFVRAYLNDAGKPIAVSIVEDKRVEIERYFRAMES